MSDNIRKIKKLMVMNLVLCFGVSAQANTTLGYEQWKAQQERHDRRLVQIGERSTSMQHLPLTMKSHVVEPKLDRKVASSDQKTQVLGSALKVNLNRATAQELSAKLESIGLKKAQAIIKYREKNGSFKKIDELKNVKGIGDKIFERNKERLKLTD